MKKKQRLSIKWIGLWMAALSAVALACEEDPEPMSGAGGSPSGGAAGSSRDSESIVDWTADTALGAVAQCSTSAHVLEGGDLTRDASGGLTAEFTVTDLAPSFGVWTLVWAVFSVEGRAWTSVSATTLD